MLGLKSNVIPKITGVLTNFIWKFHFPEPGYYEDGSFGIRLENVLVIKEADTEFNFGDKGYLSFEHITWVSLTLFIFSCPPINHVECVFAHVNARF